MTTVKNSSSKLHSKLRITSSVDLEKTTFSSAASLIAACFEARTQAHFWHLKTNSYATHVALQVFYDSLPGLADSYAESYQGIYGIIQEYPSSIFIDSATPILVVGSLQDLITNIRGNCGTQSELQNEIDNIMTLCNSTLYKLQNLK